MQIKNKQLWMAVFLLIATFFAVPLKAQVTIGALTEPHSTLEVVTLPAGSATPDGIMAPRLTGDQLKAFDSKYGPNQNSALVYATAKVSAPASAKTKNITKPGYYYYDAPNSVWVAVGAGEGWFYMPSINLPLGATVGAALTFNLYNEYVRQFTRAGNAQYMSSDGADATATDEALYKPADLKFVVTAYSGDVITVTQLDPDGTLHYTVNSVTVPDGSFINVIFKVK